MRRNHSTLTQERLREVLKYCPATGLFSWSQGGGRRNIGSIAGCKTGHGYIVITVDGVQRYAHRLAYLYIYGIEPDTIDHKDGNRSNNSIENLRSVPHRENIENQKKANAGNFSSKLLGVSYHKQAKRFRATIEVNRRQFYLGLFDTQEEAHEAYLQAKREYHAGNLL